MIKLKIIYFILLILFPTLIIMNCTKKDIEKRKYFLERVGDFQIIQVYADGFESLSLNEKILAYYLSMASLAGRDINFDQNHRHELEIRRILEGIVTHPKGIEENLFRKIEKHTKLDFLHLLPDEVEELMESTTATNAQIKYLLD